MESTVGFDELLRTLVKYADFLKEDSSTVGIHEKVVTAALYMLSSQGDKIQTLSKATFLARKALEQSEGQRKSGVLPLSDSDERDHIGTTLSDIHEHFFDNME